MTVQAVPVGLWPVQAVPAGFTWVHAVPPGFAWVQEVPPGLAWLRLAAFGAGLLAWCCAVLAEATDGTMTVPTRASARVAVVWARRRRDSITFSLESR